MTPFDELVQSALTHRLRDPGDPRWRALLPELFPVEGARAAFVEWATHHPKWRFNVADVMAQSCAKPTEAAIVILSDIVDELLDV